MDYLCGEVEHQLDAKNRIRIPAKYRAKLGKCYFIALPECIGVYTQEGIDAVYEKLKPINSSTPDLFQAKSVIIGTIQEVQEDDQGRTILSAFYRDHAKIAKDVVSVGCVDHLEIWSKEVRDEKKGGMSLTEAATLLGI